MISGIAKLKQAAEMKANIARQEAAMWNVVVEALTLLGQPKTEKAEPPRPIVEAVRANSINKYLTMKEMAEYLGISRSTLFPAVRQLSSPLICGRVRKGRFSNMWVRALACGCAFLKKTPTCISKATAIFWM
jgi:AraC-like DNA-binding protein